MYFMASIILTLCFVYTDVCVIRELFRVKALKWNATCYTLFFMLWAGVSLVFVNLIYLLNTWDADKTEYVSLLFGQPEQCYP